LRKILIYAGLGILIAGAGIYTWMQVAAVTPDQANRFHLKCTLADCGWAFTIPREQVRTWPRDPGGKGFRCEKCGKFSAQIASRCEQCGEWYAITEGVGRDGGCPKCRTQPSAR
jgi:phage FluMu protein Com